jgi:hypothetical protein
VRTAFQEADELLEEALGAAFPGLDIRRLLPSGEAQGIVYQVRFPLPLTFLETRVMVRRIREGLGRLLARFEPERYRNLREVLETFGDRETLSRVHVRETEGSVQRVTGPPGSGGAVVH